jgi:hypothetical protein
MFESRLAEGDVPAVHEAQAPRSGIAARSGHGWG